jgi:hypothetical protein
MQTVPSALRAQICKRLYSHAAAHAAAGFRVIRDGHVDVTTKTYRERCVFWAPYAVSSV